MAHHTPKQYSFLHHSQFWLQMVEACSIQSSSLVMMDKARLLRVENLRCCGSSMNIKAKEECLHEVYDDAQYGLVFQHSHTSHHSLCITKNFLKVVSFDYRWLRHVESNPLIWWWWISKVQEWTSGCLGYYVEKIFYIKVTVVRNNWRNFKMMIRMLWSLNTPTKHILPSLHSFWLP